MLNLNQLRVFYYAAKNLSFTAAAGELFITQPAVTAQIKSFEEYCNLKLFKRRGRRIFLTDEGKFLYDYAAKIFRSEKEIENVIDDMRELKRGILSLGTTKAYARYFMPLMISSFHKNYPHIKIQLNEGSSLDMINSLLEFKIEVAVIAKAADHPEVHFFPFSQEEMVLIVATDHPLRDKKGITFKDLSTEPFIMKEKGSGTRKLVEELFEAEQCTPDILMETSNTEFIKQLVQRGEGVSFVVREAVAAELKEKKLAVAPLKGSKVYLEVSIAYLKDQVLSPPARAFVDTLIGLKSDEMHPMGIGLMMAKILAQRKEAQRENSKMQKAYSDRPVFKQIHQLAKPYLSTRHNDVHTAISMRFARELLRREGGQQSIVMPAIILHDVGWKTVPENLQLKAFGPNATSPEINRTHEKEGVRIAGEILTQVHYDKEKISEILEIINGHDSRKKAISLNDQIVKDADKLWRYTRNGFHIDIERFGESYAQGLKRLRNLWPDCFFTHTARKMAETELQKREREAAHDSRLADN
jgi:DNA-binding transcriptional LysR family regulator/HD superfamily phosphohydrolase YqeK